MRSTRIISVFLLISAYAFGQSVKVNTQALKMFQPVPAMAASEKNPVTQAKVDLGRMLYYDKRLSRNHDVSCNSCHQLDKYGVDGEPTSDGHKGQRGDRNSPTVYNAAGHFVQFWDGRAADVEEQAKGPVLNPVEMAMPSEKAVLAVLTSMPEYVAAFQKAFPGEKNPVTYDNMGKAIGAFERKLLTPSRWDKFLKGDQKAITDAEKAGFNKFAEAGCHTCHAGAFLGGNMYQKAGLVKPWPNQADPGRYKVTKQEGDRLLFKVPSLRNIDKTGPYFHDGKTRTLDEAIRYMAVHQRGKDLTAAEVQSIATWLKTLTGDIPAEYIKEPVLPKSTPKTPKPSAS